jgi:hypothetical protein
VGLHRCAELDERTQLPVGEAGRAGSWRQLDPLGTPAGAGTDAQALVAQPPLQDAAGVGVDDEVVGVDGAGDDSLTQPWTRVDHSLPTAAGDRIGGEHDPGHLRCHHPLDHHGQPGAALVDGVARAVADRPVGPERRPATPHGVQYVIRADNVEVGVVLPGEAGEGKVLGGGRGPDGDWAPFVPQLGIGPQHGVGHRCRHGRRQQPLPYGRGQGRQPGNSVSGLGGQCHQIL